MLSEAKHRFWPSARHSRKRPLLRVSFETADAPPKHVTIEVIRKDAFRKGRLTVTHAASESLTPAPEGRLILAQRFSAGKRGI